MNGRRGPVENLSKPSMLACVDVHYRNDESAVAACVLSDSWQAVTAAEEVSIAVPDVEAYIPGSFYLRELPCILKVLSQLTNKPAVILVDGYVWLGAERPGLGARLYEALGRTTPVVGVAKSSFHGSTGIPVLRGKSARPLYVTAAGMEAEKAAELVKNMAGEFRVPLLLKRVDQLARGGV